MGAVAVVAGSLRARYVFDLIHRHTDAPKSQQLRLDGKIPSVGNQLNTIHLNRAATKPGPKQQRYKNPPNLKGRTVLVVDDICTQGHSLEAARSFFEAAGAKVILLSWLKTPGGNHYHAVTCLDPSIKKPFGVFKFGKSKTKLYSNSGHVFNHKAPEEIAEAYTKYSKWDWPAGI
ncbi:phosphoribosyltransferase family protein [Phaeobacter sp. CAU 1743]|uniref:phosphoribosyltransferase n=1 Tax=Phaeobacter sp. CAU 1743 TaxID=3140367 RepID=UPI00325BE9A8